MTQIPLVSHQRFAGTVDRIGQGSTSVKVADQAWNRIAGKQLEDLAFRAVREISHYLRPDHLASLRGILDDAEASANDHFVALDLLSNAVVSSREVLPMCQDTGTIIVHARRGHRVITDGKDRQWIARGVQRAFADLDLRYSQLHPLTTWTEENTGTNLPAQIHIELEEGSDYELLIMAKGGGSANKSFLFQQNRSVLDPERMLDFLREKIAEIGTSACPPYHLAVVIGGTSAEECLTTAKLASAHHLDHLPTKPGPQSWSLRDPDFEQELLRMTRELGFGAQFGGRYFCHDVRVIRMPRHNGSLPIAVAVSCSADRQIECRIDADGAWIERLEHQPEKYLPSDRHRNGQARNINLDQPMDSLLAELAECELGERLSLNGTLVVARDLVHAELRSLIERGEELPDWFKNHPVYYAGPSRTPEGYATGSFGPTTAGRMDSYVPIFQPLGGSMITLAKGNRSADVAASCGEHGGFYLGTVGGPAARLAQDCIVDSRVIDFEDFGMEAARAITVKDLPAFVVINDHGDDFYQRARKASLGARIPVGTSGGR
ncbi:fumarate hydratase [Citricoccus sp. NPDC055426]|uniref:fumarate hydratase n=1 Tax=Citricoccus sp. NPDC055426 TaxID=3155536 RepID=UPI003421A79F